MSTTETHSPGADRRHRPAAAIRGAGLSTRRVRPRAVAFQSAAFRLPDVGLAYDKARDAAATRALIRLVIEVLPQAGYPMVRIASEFQQHRRPSHRQPFHADRSRRWRRRRDARSILRITRFPSAVDQHRRQLPSNYQRRQHIDTRNSIKRPVVEIDSAGRIEHSANSHPARQCVGQAIERRN